MKRSVPVSQQLPPLLKEDVLTYVSEPDDNDNTFGMITFVCIKCCGCKRFLVVEGPAEQTQADISSDIGANTSGIRESGSENESTTANIDESSSSYGK